LELRRIEPDPLNLSVNTVVGKQSMEYMVVMKSVCLKIRQTLFLIHSSAKMERVRVLQGNFTEEQRNV
jgi:hypothetical protein